MSNNLTNRDGVLVDKPKHFNYMNMQTSNNTFLLIFSILLIITINISLAFIFYNKITRILEIQDTSIADRLSKVEVDLENSRQDIQILSNYCMEK